MKFRFTIVALVLVSLICASACANPKNEGTPDSTKCMDFQVDKATMAIADEIDHSLPGITVEVPAEKQANCITRDPNEIRDYAVYLATDSVEYTYYFNSNIIIGVDYDIHGSPVESPINEKKAEKIARDFLEEHFDNFAFYDLFGISHYESSHYYCVRFAYQKYGHVFQDIVMVNVNYAGEIMNVSAPHYGEYYDCPVTKEQLDKTVSDLGEGIRPMGVLYDDNHVLCYTYMKDDMQYYVPIYTE